MFLNTNKENIDFHMIEDRNISIDVIKGILILFVIIGHLLLGTLNENIFRFLIYAFHMPLFFFISGYLINVEKQKHLSLLGIIAKYFRRMLLQWIIALCVFTFLAYYPNLNIGSIGAYIVKPYYHLWFVPTLFVFIMFLWIILKFKNEYVLLCLIGIVSALLYASNAIVISMANGIRFEYFVWFALGIVSRKYYNKKFNIQNINKKIVWGGVFLINALIMLPLFYFHEDARGCYMKYFMVAYCLYLCLFVVLPYIINEKNTFRNKVLEKIGRNSLEIYLWHMLPIFFLKKYLVENIYIYYLIGFSVLFIFIFIFYIIACFNKKQ